MGARLWLAAHPCYVRVCVECVGRGMSILRLRMSPCFHFCHVPATRLMMMMMMMRLSVLEEEEQKEEEEKEDHSSSKETRSVWHRHSFLFVGKAGCVTMTTAVTREEPGAWRRAERMRENAVSHGLINDVQHNRPSQRSKPRLTPRQAQCPRPPRFLPVPLAIALLAATSSTCSPGGSGVAGEWGGVMRESEEAAEK